MSEITFTREEYADYYAECEIPGKFGFTIRVEDKDYHGRAIEPKLNVSLPHQCDSWDIAWEVKSKEAAREELRLFIAEAQKALEAIDLAPMGEISGPLCPECAQGKVVNCVGRTIDESDNFVECATATEKREGVDGSGN